MILGIPWWIALTGAALFAALVLLALVVVKLEDDPDDPDSHFR